MEELRFRINEKGNEELLNILFCSATFWRISTEYNYVELGILEEKIEEITKEIQSTQKNSVIEKFNRLLKTL